MEKASGQKKQSLISLILFMVWPFVIPTIAVVASAWALMAAVQAATDVPTAAAVAFVTLGLAFVSLWASRRAWPVHYVIGWGISTFSLGICYASFGICLISVLVWATG